MTGSGARLGRSCLFVGLNVGEGELGRELAQNFRSQPLGVDPGLRLRWWGGSLFLFVCFLPFLGPLSADWAVLGPVFFFPSVLGAAWLELSVLGLLLLLLLLLLFSLSG